MKRHRFLASAASAAALVASSNGVALAAPRVYERLEVAEFSAQPALVKALRDGVFAMRQITDAQDPRSWDYWHNSHRMPAGTPPPPMRDVWNKCLHHVPYFYGWHRGYLFYFEEMLRKMSGNADLALPYWDYYKNANIPPLYADKTVGGKPNPLYWENRARSRVDGLTFTAFGPSVTAFPSPPFQWPVNYEGKAEDNPHDQVHGQVGGSMGRVPTAPADPIFYAHHCNIDRLWSAWVAAGGGRKMPAQNDGWWNMTWSYDPGKQWTLTLKQMADTKTITPTVGYTYSNVKLPGQVVTLPTPPPLVKAAHGPFALTTDEFGAGTGLTLGVNSASVAVAIPPPRRSRFHTFAAAPHAGKPIALKLENVQLTQAGEQGGYSYDVFVNLPGHPTGAEKVDEYYVGSINSFAISAHQVMSPGGTVELTFALSDALQAQAREGKLKSDMVTVSFVRYGLPKGASPNVQFVKIGKVVIENAPTR